MSQITREKSTRHRIQFSMRPEMHKLYTSYKQKAKSLGLEEEVKTLRKDLYETKYSAGEQKKSYNTVLRKVKSLENELVKAKAKIRRLKKKQPPGKRVDAEPWQE